MRPLPSADLGGRAADQGRDLHLVHGAQEEGIEMRIIDTDNFGGDYPDEHFHLLCMPKDMAERICKVINDEYEKAFGSDCSRYFKVVENDYKLQPGFTP